MIEIFVTKVKIIINKRRDIARMGSKTAWRHFMDNLFTTIFESFSRIAVVTFLTTNNFSGLKISTAAVVVRLKAAMFMEGFAKMTFNLNQLD